jgi:hypothetical protein
MQRNTEIGLFTKPSNFFPLAQTPSRAWGKDEILTTVDAARAWNRYDDIAFFNRLLDREKRPNDQES